MSNSRRGAWNLSYKFYLYLINLYICRNCIHLSCPNLPLYPLFSLSLLTLHDWGLTLLLACWHWFSSSLTLATHMLRAQSYYDFVRLLGLICSSRMAVVDWGLTVPSSVTIYSENSGPFTLPLTLHIFDFVSWLETETFFGDLMSHIFGGYLNFLVQKILAYCWIDLGLLKTKFYKASVLLPMT